MPAHGRDGERSQPQLSSCLSRVPGTLFVPFKAPMDERYGEQIPPQYQWQVPQLASLMRGRLSFVINLTKAGAAEALHRTHPLQSDGYYSKAEAERHGITVQKLECAGHEQAPTEEQVTAFIEICKAYWAQHPDSIIGVGVCPRTSITWRQVCTARTASTGPASSSAAISSRKWTAPSIRPSISSPRRAPPASTSDAHCESGTA